MTFYDEYLKYRDLDFDSFFAKVTDADVFRALNKENLSPEDYLTLLSPAAFYQIESIARKAHELTVQHFGKTIQMYTPMYIANYCVNRCLYCGYNCVNQIDRKKLTMEEIELEARAIAETGMRHILLLTGESAKHTPVSYIIDAVRVLKKYFDSISIEIYPLTMEEYEAVIAEGVDTLIVYQETYNEVVYDRVHAGGPKKDYLFRVTTPERGCEAKIRNVNIGALLGLSDWRKDAFFTGLHGKYLRDKYPDTEIGISLPRIRPHKGSFEDIYPVEDRDMVQIMVAVRNFLPRANINISTRETKEFRDNILPLGVTKMSAGVSTEVGGHSSENKSEAQFEISDNRSTEEMKRSLLEKGYQPVFKDWMQI